MINLKIEEIVTSCRTGNYADAASQLNICLKKLEKILLSGAVSSELLSKIAYSLETLLIFQQQEDWIAVSDILEFELQGLLNKLDY